MQDHYKEKIPQLTLKRMDARNLKAEMQDGIFDCVIDKACFDAILCGDNSKPNSEAILNEVHRVLSPTGVYICITYGIPAMREDYFKRSDFSWTVITQKVAKQTISTSNVISGGKSTMQDESNFHYIYIMRKQAIKEA